MLSAPLKTSKDIEHVSGKHKLRSMSLLFHSCSLDESKEAILQIFNNNRAHLACLTVRHVGSKCQADLVEDIVSAFVALSSAKELKIIDCPESVMEALLESTVDRLEQLQINPKSDLQASLAGAAIQRMARLTEMEVTAPDARVLEALLSAASERLPSIERLRLKGPMVSYWGAASPCAKPSIGITKAFSSASSLTALTLERQMAASGFQQSIAKAMDAGGMPMIQELSVDPGHAANMGGADLHALLAAVSRRGSMRILGLNLCGSNACPALSDLIWAQAGLMKSSTKQGLRELRMSGLQGENATDVIDALVEADHGIERVLLHPHYGSPLLPGHFTALARSVGPDKRIRALDLIVDDDDIRVKLAAFSEGLRVGGSLTELAIGSTYLQERLTPRLDATYLVSALARKCPQLESLLLDGVHLPEGALTHLVHLTNLSRLRLPGTMERSDLPVLVDLLAGMSKLKDLSVSLSSFYKGRGHLRVLDALVRRSGAGAADSYGHEAVSLESLQVYNLPSDRTSSNLLAKVVFANRRLRNLTIGLRLVLTDGGISLENAAPLVEAVRGHPRMKTVEPRGVFTRDAHDAVCEALEKGPVALQKRRTALLCFRRGFEAKRDAGMVFQAASEGRPLELGKRLRLGVLAGGARAVGMVGGRLVSALEAARLGEHDECVRVLEGVLGKAASTQMVAR